MKPYAKTNSSKMSKTGTLILVLALKALRGDRAVVYEDARKVAPVLIAKVSEDTVGKPLKDRKALLWAKV